MERRVMYAGESNYFRDYKSLWPIAKLATSYAFDLLGFVFPGNGNANAMDR
jgi:hypothetical protein